MFSVVQRYQNNVLASCGFNFTTNLANIIEDERIETLLKHYYYGVDFKHNLKLICSLVKTPHDFEHFVFNCLRHRYSPIDKNIVSVAVANFLKATEKINGTCNKTSQLYQEMLKLLVILHKVYSKIATNQNQQQQNGNGSSSNSKSNNSMSGSENQSTDKGSQPSNNDGSENQEDKSSSSTSKCDVEDDESKAQHGSSGSASKSTNGDENTSSDFEDDPDNGNAENEQRSLSEEDAEELISDSLGEMCGQQLCTRTLEIIKSNFETRSKLKAIIARNLGFGKAKASVIYSQNGKFNVNAFIKDKQRETPNYTWFSKNQNDSASKNRQSNIKILNIWLDNSGSYQNNDFETNKVLKALYDIEKSRNDFKFRLITFGSYYTEKFGDKRVSVSTQGTTLKDFKKQYAKYNTGKEFNIFLMDGTGNYMDELSCLNNKKSALIVDQDVANYIYANNLCPNARSIKSISYGESYPKNLAENICKAFDLLF